MLEYGDGPRTVRQTTRGKLITFDPKFYMFNSYTTEARFSVLNAMAFSTEKRASVVKGLMNEAWRLSTWHKLCIRGDNCRIVIKS